MFRGYRDKRCPGRTGAGASRRVTVGSPVCDVVSVIVPVLAQSG